MTHHCGICGELLPGGSLSRRNSPHFETLHPEYLRWYKRWARRAVLVSSIWILLLALGSYPALITGNIILLLLVQVIFVLLVFVTWIRLPLKFREFARAW